MNVSKLFKNFIINYVLYKLHGVIIHLVESSWELIVYFVLDNAKYTLISVNEIRGFIMIFNILFIS